MNKENTFVLLCLPQIPQSWTTEPIQRYRWHTFFLFSFTSWYLCSKCLNNRRVSGPLNAIYIMYTIIPCHLGKVVLLFFQSVIYENCVPISILDSAYENVNPSPIYQTLHPSSMDTDQTYLTLRQQIWYLLRQRSKV